MLMLPIIIIYINLTVELEGVVMYIIIIRKIYPVALHLFGILQITQNFTPLIM